MADDQPEPQRRERRINAAFGWAALVGIAMAGVVVALIWAID